MSTDQTTITLSPADLERLIRRVVREEISRVLHTPIRTILEDRQHEGPDDPTEDDQLLVDALAVLNQYKDDPNAWMSWDDFEAELDKV